jgi:hypothetical protein
MADTEVDVLAVERPAKVYKGDGVSLTNLFFTANFIFSMFVLVVSFFVFLVVSFLCSFLFSFSSSLFLTSLSL